MDVAHVGLVNGDPCRCKVKSFRMVSSIERNVSKRHLQGVRHLLFEDLNFKFFCLKLKFFVIDRRLPSQSSLNNTCLWLMKCIAVK